MNTYVVINTDKRTKPWTYRLQIIKILPNGQRKTKSHKSFRGTGAKTKAKQEKMRLENELMLGNTGVTDAWTIKKFSVYFMVMNKKHWSRGYALERSRIFKDFINFCDKKNLVYLEDVKQMHLETYIAGLPEDWKIRTVNIRKTLLKQFFGKAVDIELIYRNPARKIKKNKEIDKEKTKPLTDAQIITLANYFQKYKPDFLPMYKLLLYTGMRRAEICAIQWDWINFQQDFIEIPAEKTKAKYKRIVPLHVEAKKLLLGLERKGSKIFDLHKDTASDYFTAACRELGLQGVSLHSTRATFITQALRSGDTIAVQAIVGHKDLTTTQGYTQAFEEAKRRVISKLDF